MAEQGRRAHYQVTFAVLSAGVAAYALLQSLVIPVLGTVQSELHTTQSAVTWTLTAYLLSASIFTPIMGRIGDIAGKERMFVVTLLALAAGSLLAAVAPSIGIMILARAIQGIGGGVLPLAFGIVRDEFPADKVTGAVGALASLTAVGGGLGTVLAGPIVSALSWRWLFWIPMVVTIVAAIAAHFFVPESPVRTPGTISWTPAVLLSGFLVAFLVPLSEASDWGWGSVRVIGLLVLAVVLAVGWVVCETRVAKPLIDMRMMRMTAVWTNNLAALLIGVGMYAAMAFLPEFVQTPTSTGYGFGASITQSGLMVLPMAAGMFVVALYAGRMAAIVGGKTLVVAGGIIGAVGMGMLALAHGQRWEIYVATAILGCGIGLAFSSMSGLIVAAVPAAQTGVASGMNANIRTIGGSIGSALMATIVTAHLSDSGLPKESGYTAGFVMLAVALLLSAGAGALIPAVRLRRPTGPEDAPHAELGLVAAGTLVGDESE
jgi:EmrB/QacA subfamily drug resistance transporter